MIWLWVMNVCLEGMDLMTRKCKSWWSLLKCAVRCSSLWYIVVWYKGADEYGMVATYLASRSGKGFFRRAGVAISGVVDAGSLFHGAL